MQVHMSVLLCFTITHLSLSSINAQGADTLPPVEQPETMVVTSPCDDSLYVVLSSIPIDSMSANQSVYYSNMRGRCIERQQYDAEVARQMEVDKQDQAEREQSAQDIARGASTAVVVVVLIAIVLAITGIVVINYQLDDARQ